MPLYQVSLERIQAATIRIDARSPADARKKARELVEGELAEIFESLNGHTTRVETHDVRRVERDGQ